jgi:g-D-glutamyl-meso-diaminopimelate peptidase
MGGAIGRSVMGKNIPVVKIGNGQTEVFYNASHHANEWITTPVVLKFLEEYAESYATGGEIFNRGARELYNKASLYIAPMVNLDGVDLVNGVVPNGIFLDKAIRLSQNYPNIPYPNGWKANINGVDLNLQYPANWESAKEIKFSQGFTLPGPRDYVGTAPLTEPEARAVYNFTRNHDFKLTLSYHSQGEIIYWKYLDYEPENSRRIAEYFGEVSGYSVEETPYASGFAGYKDWFIETYNRPGYTIEVGIGMSPLPLSQFPKIYTDNIGILVGGITEI